MLPRLIALLLLAGCATASVPAESYLTTSDGVRLFLRRVGNGPQTVVYLHGGPGAQIADGGYEMDALARGRTIVMYDQRGGGRSDMPADAKLYTVARHVEDVEEVRRHLGVDRVSIIGLSWGSALAALYA
ncbi:MAG TPA: alpha/beta fold hydrolase, partial [Thermoanaerobaculia bacterium]